MIMKFKNVSDGMKNALFDFCMKQTCFKRYATYEEIEEMVYGAFYEMEGIPSTYFTVSPVYRYSMKANENLKEELLPCKASENSIMYQRAITLGTFMMDGFVSDCDDEVIATRGYEVIYDLDSREIKLLYYVTTRNDEITSMYRVEADMFEGFDEFIFIPELKYQMIEQLKQSLYVPSVA